MGKARSIKVGDRFEKVCGKNVSQITITGIPAEGETAYSYSTKTGKEGTMTAEAIGKLKFVSHGTKSGKAREPRLNATTCLKAAIDAILSAGKPVHSKEIVSIMKEKGSFKFKDSAKTPWNSVNTRLTQELLNNPKAPYQKADGIRGAFVPRGFKVTCVPTEVPATA